MRLELRPRGTQRVDGALRDETAAAERKRDERRRGVGVLDERRERAAADACALVNADVLKRRQLGAPERAHARVAHAAAAREVEAAQAVLQAVVERLQTGGGAT